MHFTMPNAGLADWNIVVGKHWMFGLGGLHFVPFIHVRFTKKSLCGLSVVKVE